MAKCTTHRNIETLLAMLNLMVWIACLQMVVNIITADSAIEGSGEVCDVEGSTCPEDKCCSDAVCAQEGENYNCCDDPKHPDMDFSQWVVSEEGQRMKCANCPKCSKDTKYSLN